MINNKIFQNWAQNQLQGQTPNSHSKNSAPMSDYSLNSKSQLQDSTPRLHSILYIMPFRLVFVARHSSITCWRFLCLGFSIISHMFYILSYHSVNFYIGLGREIISISFINKRLKSRKRYITGNSNAMTSFVPSFILYKGFIALTKLCWNTKQRQLMEIPA